MKSRHLAFLCIFAALLACADADPAEPIAAEPASERTITPPTCAAPDACIQPRAEVGQEMPGRLSFAYPLFVDISCAAPGPCVPYIDLCSFSLSADALAVVSLRDPAPVRRAPVCEAGEEAADYSRRWYHLPLNVHLVIGDLALPAELDATWFEGSDLEKLFAWPGHLLFSLRYSGSEWIVRQWVALSTDADINAWLGRSGVRDQAIITLPDTFPAFQEAWEQTIAGQRSCLYTHPTRPQTLQRSTDDAFATAVHDLRECVEAVEPQP